MSTRNGRKTANLIFRCILPDQFSGCRFESKECASLRTNDDSLRLNVDVRTVINRSFGVEEPLSFSCCRIQSVQSARNVAYKDETIKISGGGGDVPSFDFVCPFWFSRLQVERLHPCVATGDEDRITNHDGTCFKESPFESLFPDDFEFIAERYCLGNPSGCPDIAPIQRPIGSVDVSNAERK
jgi:hypothetical protein